MLTAKRITATLALALLAATVPAAATAANFDNKGLEGVYSSTASSGSVDRALAYVVDTKADGKAAGVDYVRNSGATARVVAWGGNSSRASSSTIKSDKVVALRSCKTDNNPLTADLFGSWSFNNN